MTPESKKSLEELWDLLYHNYTLAEFYDDLEDDLTDEILRCIIKYNGDEFENLYNEYKAWVHDAHGDVVKPKRPDDIVNWEEHDDEEDRLNQNLGETICN